MLITGDSVKNGVGASKMFTLEFQSLVLVEIVDKKGFKNLSVPVLSSTTPDKQENACLPPNVPANPSIHQKVENYLLT